MSFYPSHILPFSNKLYQVYSSRLIFDFNFIDSIVAMQKCQRLNKKYIICKSGKINLNVNVMTIFNKKIKNVVK